MGFMKKYAVDKDAVSQGTWVLFDEGVEIKIASLKSDEAKKLRRKLEAPYRAMREIPAHVQEDILTKMLAQVVVKDWKGLTDEEGNAITFSVEKADELLRKYPEFLEDVIVAATSRETFREDGVEAVKNG